MILAQTGGVFAVNIANPAAPFFDGDAVSQKGTPAGRDGVDDGVLFNDNGTNNDGVGVFPPIDASGGNQNTWDLVQVSPTILLLMGSSSTGGQSLVGTALVRVIDVSDPRNIRLIRDIPIPGAVHAFGAAVDGDVAVVTASQGGFQNGSLTFAGNIVLATLDLSDPANPTAHPLGSPGRRGARRRLRLHGRGAACSRSGQAGPPVIIRPCTCSTRTTPITPSSRGSPPPPHSRESRGAATWSSPPTRTA